MADVTVSNDSLDNAGGLDSRRTVMVSTSVGYYFYATVSTKEVKYVKTTDGGATWDTPVLISSATNGIGMPSVWYDRWTPGITGTLIHIVYARDLVDAGYHRALDTSDDSLTAEGTINTGTAAGIGNMWSVAKSRGGNLYCVFKFSANVNTSGFAKSTDNGLNWTDKADPWSGEDTIKDGALLFPGGAADADDMWLIFWDQSASELSLKTYDDSGNSFSEVSISGSMTFSRDADVGAMFGSVRHTDNHVILAVHDDVFNASHNFKVFDINGAGSITAKTNIFSATSDKFHGCVALDSSNDDIYVGYVKSTTPFTVQEIVYVKSDDGGATWGSEIQVHVTDRAYNTVTCDLGSANDTKWQPVFWDTTSKDAFVNLATSVAIGGGTPTFLHYLVLVPGP